MEGREWPEWQIQDQMSNAWFLNPGSGYLVLLVFKPFWEVDWKSLIWTGSLSLVLIRPVVPNMFCTRDRLHVRQYFHRQHISPHLNAERLDAEHVAINPYIGRTLLSLLLLSEVSFFRVLKFLPNLNERGQTAGNTDQVRTMNHLLLKTTWGRWSWKSF